MLTRNVAKKRMNGEKKRETPMDEKRNDGKRVKLTMRMRQNVMKVGKENSIEGKA